MQTHLSKRSENGRQNQLDQDGYFDQYQVDDLLKDADVLDIGSNTGFVAIYCAKFSKEVLGIGLNPYLNRVARETAEYLKVKNAQFMDVDFKDFQTEDRFDVVLSLSNHHTIDENLDLGFKNHISRISDLLRPDGVMLFESHNVFGPGEGGAGDDGDMEAKVEIMSKFFKIERYRMVRRFLEHGDVDKLFIVARKTEVPKPISFDLIKSRRNYEWTQPTPVN